MPPSDDSRRNHGSAHPAAVAGHAPAWTVEAVIEGLEIVDLGRLPYEAADERQRAIHQQVVRGTRPGAVLTVEHEPVVTVSRRAAAADHVRADARALAAHGIELAETDRGGDVTYHGPGQLVVYPVIPLAPFRLNVRRYMRLLERAVADALEALGVSTTIEEGRTGVWIPGERPEKVCAIGVRVSRNVTLHGLALNVAPDLGHFDWIVPCGIADRGVTSLARLLGDDAPDWETARAQVLSALLARLRRCGSESGP